jgi:hypothetical protein
MAKRAFAPVAPVGIHADRMALTSEGGCQR